VSKSGQQVGNGSFAIYHNCTCLVV
jgi:hypothetical protein